MAVARRKRTDWHRFLVTLECDVTDQPNEGKPNEPSSSIAEFGKVLVDLSNAELLTALDVMLVELEKRLAHYARVGPELIHMADEGLVLAVRARARLGQAQSSTQHAESHLQIVGVGGWSPRSTRPSWNDDPRISDGND
jgi:hypothetical protein